MMFETAKERADLVRKLNQEYCHIVYLESNDYRDALGKYRWLIMAGNETGFEANGDSGQWERLSGWLEQNSSSFKAGFICYGAGKGEDQADETGFPGMAFFKPTFIRGLKRNGEIVESGPLPAGSLVDETIRTAIPAGQPIPFKPEPSLKKEEYLRRFEQIRQNLLRGNIYEVNFCQAFSVVRHDLDFIDVWLNLNRLSPAPFASLVKYADAWLAGASPERYICKRDRDIFSQPIKGTCKRTGHPETDAQLARGLKSSEKERSENIMIVDLVRNDLSVTLQPGSVKVEELCGLYSFARVQHLISTIRGRLPEHDNGFKTLAYAFPMGSMTGAPKKKAVEIARFFEPFNRGIYSGTTGYFDPEDDFDFNVVIRSIAWNKQSGLLRFAAGSAVTVGAEAETEYEECLLKAESMFECLSNG